MTDLHFVDSNVLVYRHDRDEREKQAKAQEVMEVLWRGRTGRLSDQVLHEFYVISTKKLATPVHREVARREVRQLQTWRPVPATADLRERAWEIEDRFGLSWWDSLIVAAAQQAGCRYLLSEDLQDGQHVTGLLIVNPFAHDLDEIGLSPPGGT